MAREELVRVMARHTSIYDANNEVHLLQGLAANNFYKFLLDTSNLIEEANKCALLEGCAKTEYFKAELLKVIA